MLTKTARQLSSVTALAIAAVLGFGAAGAGDANAMPRTVVTHTKMVEPGWHGAHGAVTWHRGWPRRRWGWRGARGAVACHTVWINGVPVKRCGRVW